MGNKKLILVCGIDNFSKKNINQIKYGNNFGYEFSIFTNNSLGNSFDNCFEPNKIFLLERTFKDRFLQIFFFVRNNKKNINHCEIYPGGRFSIFYLIICKIFNIPTLIVERGDLVNWKLYSSFYKIVLKKVYTLSDAVCYRELYMKEILESFNVKKMYFLNNCIDSKDVIKNSNYQYYFLWVNRLTLERKSKWFIEIINEHQRAKSALIGLLNQESNSQEIYAKKSKSKYLEVLNYQNPEKYYLNSKFFVLPADLVYLNNSLLEAMSYGLVPLISNVEGSELIVDDGVDGFIFEHSKEGLKSAMEKALNLTEEEYKIMSKNAIQKVRDKFSCKTWCKKYIKMIEELKNV